MRSALSLVEVHGQHALTTSLAVAEGCGVQHKNVLAMIRKYVEEFSEFGRVAFETRPFPTAGGVQEHEIALLNEDHATYLITLLRNNDQVRLFKRTLVKAFRRALDEIHRLYANPPRQDLLAGKRAAHHPMMVALIEGREEAGKKLTPAITSVKTSFATGL